RGKKHERRIRGRRGARQRPLSPPASPLVGHTRAALSRRLPACRLIPALGPHLSASVAHFHRACRSAAVGARPASEADPQAREARARTPARRSEEHTSELQSLAYLVCRLLLEKKNKISILLLSLITKQHQTTP